LLSDGGEALCAARSPGGFSEVFSGLGSQRSQDPARRACIAAPLSSAWAARYFWTM